MTINVENISNEIFKILQGYQYRVDKMFTLDGQEATDPDSARRFYNKASGMMVTIDDSEATLEISVNLGKHADLDDLKPVLNNIRNVAVKNLAEYTLNTFGKGIKPRDFAMQARQASKRQDIGEGLSRLSGSTLESFQTLDDQVKLIVQHTEAIDPNVHGSRSRKIKNLFIENSDGERFKFPVNNLLSARAMTRYINEGGQPADQIGRYIVSLAEEKEFLKQARRQLTDSIALDAARTRFNELKETIGDLNKKRKFKQFVEEFDNRVTQQINESEFNEVCQNELQGLDEDMKSSPYAQTLAHRIQTEKYLPESDRLVKEVLNSVKDFPTGLFEDSVDDPLMPANLRFYDLTEKLRYELEYYSRAMMETNTELSESVKQLAGIVHYMKPSRQKFLEKLLTTGFDAAKMQRA